MGCLSRFPSFLVLSFLKTVLYTIPCYIASRDIADISRILNISECRHGTLCSIFVSGYDLTVCILSGCITGAGAILCLSQFGSVRRSVWLMS